MGDEVKGILPLNREFAIEVLQTVNVNPYHAELQIPSSYDLVVDPFAICSIGTHKYYSARPTTHLTVDPLLDRGIATFGYCLPLIVGRGLVASIARIWRTCAARVQSAL
jgi:hypothetical protein